MLRGDDIIENPQHCPDKVPIPADSNEGLVLKSCCQRGAACIHMFDVQSFAS